MKIFQWWEIPERSAMSADNHQAFPIVLRSFKGKQSIPPLAVARYFVEVWFLLPLGVLLPVQENVDDLCTVMEALQVVYARKNTQTDTLDKEHNNIDIEISIHSRCSRGVEVNLIIKNKRMEDGGIILSTTLHCLTKIL
jgi:hypothetical protein